jgi:hypothetical protein
MPGDAFLSSLLVNPSAVAGSDAADEHLGLLERIASVINRRYRRISHLLGPCGEAGFAAWLLPRAR